jgi:hypothetical protein
MQKDRNNDGFAARQPACALIHMQQRGWICSSSQGQCRALAQALGHNPPRQPAKMQRKGLVEGIGPTAAGVRGRRQTSPQVCAGQARTPSALLTLAPASRCSCRTWTCPMPTSTPEGFRYVLLLLRDYSKLSQVSTSENEGRCAHHILNPTRLENMWRARSSAYRPRRGVYGRHAWTRCTRSVASRGADGPVLFNPTGLQSG